MGESHHWKRIGVWKEMRKTLKTLLGDLGMKNLLVLGRSMSGFIDVLGLTSSIGLRFFFDTIYWLMLKGITCVLTERFDYKSSVVFTHTI